MTDHLEDSLTHSDTLTPQALLVQTTSSTTNADGVTNDLLENDNDKPVILELGVTTSVTPTTTDLTTIPYTSDYPLDIHMNNIYSSIGGMTTHSHTYNTDAGLLYSNPYSEGALHHQTLHGSLQTASGSLISVNTSPYIPQTVYSLSTPIPVTGMIPPDVNNKLPPTDIVPSPIYMTYRDVREHTISKDLNPSWKEKALQSEKDYKKTACDRERTRMRDMNRAFDLLRSKLPISKPNGKKYSKIESLRIAINYINHLQKSLQDNTIDPNNQTAVDYLNELNVRRRSSSHLHHHQHHHYDNHKSHTFDGSNDKLENLDESHSTWSDSYVPNSQDKWE